MKIIARELNGQTRFNMIPLQGIVEESSLDHNEINARKFEELPGS